MSSEKVSGGSSDKKAGGRAKRVLTSSKKAMTKKKETRNVKAPEGGNVNAGRRASSKAGLKKEKKPAKAAIQDKKPERRAASRAKDGASETRAGKHTPKKKATGSAATEVGKKAGKYTQKSGKVAALVKKSLAGKQIMPDVWPASKEKEALKVGKELKTAAVVERPAKKSRGRTPKGTVRAKTSVTAGGREEAGTKREETSDASAPKESQPASWEKFPVEYGENAVTLMPVDPHKLFVFWEVRKDSAEIYKGDLTIRVYDTAGDGFDPAVKHSYFDVPAGGRMGRKYIDARPGSGFVAEIGISQDDIFITLARSPGVSTPPAELSPADDSSKEPTEREIRAGY